MESWKHNQNCIARATEMAMEGRRVTYQSETATFRVPSRTNPSRPPYRVRVQAVWQEVAVSCNCEAGRSQSPLGDTPCWHGAAACLEASRSGLVAFDGKRWVLGAVGAELTRKPPYVTAGPFCCVCGESVDDLVLVPVDRQAVTNLDGRMRHRGCAPLPVQ